MRARTWAAIFAIVGVLVHANVGVRHSATVLAGFTQHHALLAGLGVICRGAGGASALFTSDIPYAPGRPKNGDCPVCGGLAQGSVVLSAVRLEFHVDSSDRAARAIVVAGTIPTSIPVCPPSTGPPLVA